MLSCLDVQLIQDKCFAPSSAVLSQGCTTASTMLPSIRAQILLLLIKDERKILNNIRDKSHGRPTLVGKLNHLGQHLVDVPVQLLSLHMDLLHVMLQGLQAGIQILASHAIICPSDEDQLVVSLPNFVDPAVQLLQLHIALVPHLQCNHLPIVCP